MNSEIMIKNKSTCIQGSCVYSSGGDTNTRCTLWNDWMWSDAPPLTKPNQRFSSTLTHSEYSRTDQTVDCAFILFFVLNIIFFIDSYLLEQSIKILHGFENLYKYKELRWITIWLGIFYAKSRALFCSIQIIHFLSKKSELSLDLLSE